MENLHLNLGETPQHTLVAKHGIILSQSYGQKFSHTHKMTHNNNSSSNTNNNNSSSNNTSSNSNNISNNNNSNPNTNTNNNSSNTVSSKLSGDHDHSHQSQMQQMQIQMERALSGDNTFSLSLGQHQHQHQHQHQQQHQHQHEHQHQQQQQHQHPHHGSGSTSGRGHHFNYTHGQAYGHGMDNGDSLAVVPGMRDIKSRTLANQASYASAPGLAASSVSSQPAPLSSLSAASSPYVFKPQAELAAKSTLNAAASAYTIHGGGTVAVLQQHFGLGSSQQQQQQYHQHLLQSPQQQSQPQTQQQHQQEHQHHHQHHQQSPHLGLLPKPTYSAPSQFGATHVLSPPSEPGDFQLNVGAASFTPSQGMMGLPLSSQSQPLLQTPHPTQSQVYMPKSHAQTMRWRRQPLPDLFNAVLGLMRELNRSVSYPEIISTLSMRLQRTEADLKRHVPHTLHSAVTNGYLRKDGNRYTMLSELEQVEIMRRNQEAAQRAKELEKEPLSWRKR